MKAEELVQIYVKDDLTNTLSELISKPCIKIHLPGLKGSADALLTAALSVKNKRPFIFVATDKEEAHYVYNDLQSLVPDAMLHFFPVSYKKPYQFEETDNANVLQRAEVLTSINHSGHTYILVTYPEALAEKVIKKKKLVDSIYTIRKGDRIEIESLTSWLSQNHFEKNDFVYEAGQFALRGGILDIFSYSGDRPLRIDFVGDEVEQIKYFNPESQLSESETEVVSIVPNVQQKLYTEEREHFLEFISEEAICLVKDSEMLLDITEQQYAKAENIFEKAKLQSGGNALLVEPDVLFTDRDSMKVLLKKFRLAEMNTISHWNDTHKVEFEFKAQPNFNKEFNLLADDLSDKQTKGFLTIITAESFKQTDRLQTIFDEIKHGLEFRAMHEPLREGFIDPRLKIAVYTDHQIFERYHRFRVKEKYSRSKAITMKELRSLHAGDYVTHADYGIARFAGLEKIDVNGKPQEAIRLVFKDDDLLYINIHQLHKISRYSGKDGVMPTMSKLGSGEWEQKKSKIKKQVKDIAKELIRLYALRKAAPGFSFSRDSFLQAELESSFMYEDTPDQAKATADVKVDMENPHPMDRLVCGDVGFGKTEIAIRAAFKAVCDNKQVAILVPTTVLAMQHFKTFRDRLKHLPCVVEYVNRFKTATQVKETLKRVQEGKTNILIGTHKLIGKDVKFQDLGLLIIDEEQKFGVKVKEKLKELKVNLDTLTLTATPIPRTLHFSLMGARDLSIIATPPPNRQPVTTEIHVFNEELIRDSVRYELKRGGQVFFVHNRISDIFEIAATVKRLVPDARVAVGHGQMEGDKLEEVMMGFVDGEYDVLVSTNIIESGLDIPNANTIIINRAHMFGLSDLHQMRGRVGRSNKKAFCYLLTSPLSTLPTDSRKRLQALEEFSDLGDGFKVAMRDMDIRGAGNLLGAEQSGFISDIGFDMYHKILDEAISELKETEFRALFEKEIEARELKALQPDCTIETDLSIIIPDDYITNISERLHLYNTLDNLKDEKELALFSFGLIDRFGPLPPQTEDLIKTVELRWLAEKLGFEKLMIKNNYLRVQFVPSENESYYKSDVFGKILDYVQHNSRTSKLKEANKKLVLQFDQITSIDAAFAKLEEIKKHVGIQS